MATVEERLNELINLLEDGNQEKFSKRTKVDKSQVSLMLSGKIGLGMREYKILAAYPELSRDWLHGEDCFPGFLTVELTKKYYEERIKNNEETIRTLSEALLNLSRKN